MFRCPKFALLSLGTTVKAAKVDEGMDQHYDIQFRALLANVSQSGECRVEHAEGLSRRNAEDWGRP